MIAYADISNTLHTRGVEITTQDFFFVLLVTLGERKDYAYAMAYDNENFKKHIGTDEEGEYLASHEKDANTMLIQQHIVQLSDIINEAYRADIQAKALNLEEYRFSGEETVKILNNLLKTRIDDLESSSVKDVVGIIKMLTEQGALESGNGGFAKHFIHIHPKFNALCTSCNREFDVFAGIDCICPHCGQVYRWSEEERRFYPQPSKL